MEQVAEGWRRSFLWEQLALLPPDTLHLQSRVWEGVKFLHEVSSSVRILSPLRTIALSFQECSAQVRQGPPMMLLEETNQLRIVEY